MALKDETRPVYIKIIDESGFLTDSNSETGARALIGTIEFLTASDRSAWEAGDKVFSERKSYIIELDTLPALPEGWTGTQKDWLKTLCYSAMKSEAAINQYPELAGLVDC